MSPVRATKGTKASKPTPKRTRRRAAPVARPVVKRHQVAVVSEPEPLSSGSVLVPPDLAVLLREWPDLMDRLRYRVLALYPLAQSHTIQQVREFFYGVPAHVSVAVAFPPAIWAIVREWPALLRRAMYSGLALTVDEAAAILAAEQSLRALEDSV